jgi:asparagine synthase (glutamine-hydrolysing)
MAHGLEVRVPLLDHVFAEWAGTLPTRAKLRGREGKYVLKKALEPLLPADLLYRPKMGFAVPLGSWLRGPVRGRVQQAVSGEAVRDCGLFEPAAVDALVDQHMRGLRDHSQPIWALLMFAGFLDQVHARSDAASAVGAGAPGPGLAAAPV